ncbi:hypothetical protein WN943_003906 [Citrus x changshan-huyou]
MNTSAIVPVQWLSFTSRKCKFSATDSNCFQTAITEEKAVSYRDLDLQVVYKIVQCTISANPNNSPAAAESLIGATVSFEFEQQRGAAVVLRKKMIAARTVSYFCFFYPNVSLFQLLVIQGKPELVADDETKMAQMIPTKARSIQMNMELEQHCKAEISDLEFKGLIVKSQSPWSCAAFYVNKNSEIERGTLRLEVHRDQRLNSEEKTLGKLEEKVPSRPVFVHVDY